MPIVYLPYFFRDLDYRILLWLDKNDGSTEISFDFLDYLDKPITKVQFAIKRLAKDGYVLMKFDGSDMIGIELTHKAQVFLAEHILGQIASKRSK